MREIEIKSNKFVLKKSNGKVECDFDSTLVESKSNKNRMKVESCGQHLSTVFLKNRIEIEWKSYRVDAPLHP